MRAGAERVVLKKGSPEGLRLICVPFAGGSARSFARLATMVGEDWSVVAVQPPRSHGDGERDLDALAHFYLGLLAEDLRGPGLLFGHSLGAAVVHRMAQLWSSHWPKDLHVVLSAPPAPEFTSAGLYGLDDQMLFEVATEQGILPALGVSEDMVKRLMLPDLRADLAVLAKRGWTATPLKAPVHLMGGERDLPSPPAVLEQYREILQAVSLRLLQAGHMYVLEQPAETAEALLAIGASVGKTPVAAQAGRRADA
ncbi:alpha/beta fold hydrolase [Streptomyces sp. NA04227]|uniref:thioesterase II family protein n=1 Tax=Streptomyces sp. NA04227 TaxID=2742136 RepID=UPI000A20BDE0|nr:alpha/beta fold hydrolase [Streptomyces sp. NA04227]ARM20259.1 SauT [Streptomyces sp.]QKW07485.1 alpha/beta fold hydrolase [Streptomyces sp. NA04227]